MHLALRRGGGLASLFGLKPIVELVQEPLEPVRYTLAENVIVKSLQDVTKPSLVLAAEASPGLS
jgi:hypothetical protein